jgi:hypothetical protein
MNMTGKNGLAHENGPVSRADFVGVLAAGDW